MCVDSDGAQGGLASPAGLATEEREGAADGLARLGASLATSTPAPPAGGAAVLTPADAASGASGRGHARE
eukprot:14958558-Alexandrium_andersonii.AAC.1